MKYNNPVNKQEDSDNSEKVLFIFHYFYVSLLLLIYKQSISRSILIIIAGCFEFIKSFIPSLSLKYFYLLVIITEFIFCHGSFDGLTSFTVQIKFASDRLVPGISGSTSGSFDVFVSHKGTLRSPLPNNEVASLISAAAFETFEDIYITGDDISIVIPARDEEKFIIKTIKYILETTPLKQLKEIIIVDDASEIPIEDIIAKEKFSKQFQELIHVYRKSSKEGLIRARIFGADKARASNILFLDAHCRPYKKWLPPLLQHLKVNYRRAISPTIEDIDQTTWNSLYTSGRKMIMDWKFEFNWYEDLSDEVPITAGGVIAMTKKWWNECGKLDPGMLEWGGENVEFSFRSWLCGGEIIVSQSSTIGHIFTRPPRKQNQTVLIHQIWRNHHSAAKVWLDDYYPYFLKIHFNVLTVSENEGVNDRFLLKQNLNCLPFAWFKNKFHSALERQNFFFFFEAMQIVHDLSQNCLVVENDKVFLGKCEEKQLWVFNLGKRMLQSTVNEKCLSLTNVGKPDQHFIMAQCQWNRVASEADFSQVWIYHPKSKNIYNSYSLNIKTITGSDVYKQSDNILELNPKPLCIMPLHNNNTELGLAHCHASHVENNQQAFTFKTINNA